MSWELLTAISVITTSVSVILQRVLLHNDKSDPIAYAIVFQGLTAIFFAIFALFEGFKMPDFTKYWFPVTATFVLYAIGNVIYAKTLQKVEASIFSTLLATSTIWVVLMSYFLFAERPNSAQILGGLIIFGSVGILMERSGKLKLDTGIMMGLFMGLIFGLAKSAWIYVGKEAGVGVWNALACAVPALLLLLTNHRSVSKMKPLLTGRVFTKMLLLCILFAVCNLASLAAYQVGKVSVITPLMQTNVIITVILAIIILGERKRLWQKVMAAVVCFIGVLLIIV
ncbi:MAG TPA: DMT family transporter [Xanthomonadales bacterium]|nr:DMT family transporter [Xanthomonadales bacterium]